jgi:hypothetical protein
METLRWFQEAYGTAFALRRPVVVISVTSGGHDALPTP